MRVAFRERYGPPEVVELREVDKPEIEPHQVLVRVHASSLNAADWYDVAAPPFVRVLGGGGLRKPKTSELGADLAGRVEAVGADVTELRVGDEVFGTSGASWAEYAPAREVRLALKPSNVSFEEAAAVPIAALTALQALRDHGQIQPGQRVLINGASGGVGTYAVQIAKALGAEVTAVCSPRNVEQSRALGADRVVDYTQEDFTKLDARHDLIIDIAGSRPFSKLRRVLEPEGTVVLVGAKFPGTGLVGPLGHVIRTRLAAIGKSQQVKFFVARINNDDLDVMRKLLESGQIRSVIDKAYPLSEIRDALRYLGEGHARGKVVITM
jgi:NADPH:quinone reductase-like Zn-dependent oxidoreductase